MIKEKKERQEPFSSRNNLLLFEILEINKQNCATHTERDRHDKYVDTHILITQNTLVWKIVFLTTQYGYFHNIAFK